MEHDITGTEAPDVTENEKRPRNGADDIKSGEFDRENMGKSAG